MNVATPAAADPTVAEAFWTLVHGNRELARAAALDAGALPANTIEGWLVDAAGTTAEQRIALAAAANPNTDPVRLRGWFSSGGQLCAITTRNPTLGTLAAQRYTLLPAWRQTLALTNPGVPVEFLAARAAEYPAHAAQNPSIDPDTLQGLLESSDDDPSVWREALKNPALGAGRVAELLRDTPDRRAVHLVRNPAARISDLEAYAERVAYHWARDSAHEAIRWRRAQLDPMGAPAAWLRSLPYGGSFAAQLVAEDRATHGAVGALLRASFEGTVAELIACAHATAG